MNKPPPDKNVKNVSRVLSRSKKDVIDQHNKPRPVQQRRSSAWETFLQFRKTFQSQRTHHSDATSAFHASKPGQLSSHHYPTWLLQASTANAPLTFATSREGQQGQYLVERSGSPLDVSCSSASSLQAGASVSAPTEDPSIKGPQQHYNVKHPGSSLINNKCLLYISPDLLLETQRLLESIRFAEKCQIYRTVYDSPSQTAFMTPKQRRRLSTRRISFFLDGESPFPLHDQAHVGANLARWRAAVEQYPIVSAAPYSALIETLHTLPDRLWMQEWTSVRNRIMQLDGEPDIPSRHVSRTTATSRFECDCLPLRCRGVPRNRVGVAKQSYSSQQPVGIELLSLYTQLAEIHEQFTWFTRAIFELLRAPLAIKKTFAVYLGAYYARKAMVEGGSDASLRERGRRSTRKLTLFRRRRDTVQSKEEGRVFVDPAIQVSRDIVEYWAAECQNRSESQETLLQNPKLLLESELKSIRKLSGSELTPSPTFAGGQEAHSDITPVASFAHVTKWAAIGFEYHGVWFQNITSVRIWKTFKREVTLARRLLFHPHYPCPPLLCILDTIDTQFGATALLLSGCTDRSLATTVLPDYARLEPQVPVQLPNSILQPALRVINESILENLSFKPNAKSKSCDSGTPQTEMGAYPTIESRKKNSSKQQQRRRRLSALRSQKSTTFSLSQSPKSWVVQALFPSLPNPGYLLTAYSPQLLALAGDVNVDEENIITTAIMTFSAIVPHPSAEQFTTAMSKRCAASPLADKIHLLRFGRSLGLALQILSLSRPSPRAILESGARHYIERWLYGPQPSTSTPVMLPPRFAASDHYGQRSDRDCASFLDRSSGSLSQSALLSAPSIVSEPSINVSNFPQDLVTVESLYDNMRLPFLSGKTYVIAFSQKHDDRPGILPLPTHWDQASIMRFTAEQLQCNPLAILPFDPMKENTYYTEHRDSPWKVEFLGYRCSVWCPDPFVATNIRATRGGRRRGASGSRLGLRSSKSALSLNRDLSITVQSIRIEYPWNSASFAMVPAPTPQPLRPETYMPLFPNVCGAPKAPPPTHRQVLLIDRAYYTLRHYLGCPWTSSVLHTVLHSLGLPISISVWHLWNTARRHNDIWFEQLIACDIVAAAIKRVVHYYTAAPGVTYDVASIQDTKRLIHVALWLSCIKASQFLDFHVHSGVVSDVYSKATSSLPLLRLCVAERCRFHNDQRSAVNSTIFTHHRRIAEFVSTAYFSRYPLHQECQRGSVSFVSPFTLGLPRTAVDSAIPIPPSRSLEEGSQFGSHAPDCPTVPRSTSSRPMGSMRVTSVPYLQDRHPTQRSTFPAREYFFRSLVVLGLGPQFHALPKPSLFSSAYVPLWRHYLSCADCFSFNRCKVTPVPPFSWPCGNEKLRKTAFHHFLSSLRRVDLATNRKLPTSASDTCLPALLYPIETLTFCLTISLHARFAAFLKPSKAVLEDDLAYSSATISTATWYIHASNNNLPFHVMASLTILKGMGCILDAEKDSNISPSSLENAYCRAAYFFHAALGCLILIWGDPRSAGARGSSTMLFPTWVLLFLYQNVFIANATLVVSELQDIFRAVRLYTPCCPLPLHGFAYTNTSTNLHNLLSHKQPTEKANGQPSLFVLKQLRNILSQRLITWIITTLPLNFAGPCDGFQGAGILHSNHEETLIGSTTWLIPYIPQATLLESGLNLMALREIVSEYIPWGKEPADVGTSAGHTVNASPNRHMIDSKERVVSYASVLTFGSNTHGALGLGQSPTLQLPNGFLLPDKCDMEDVTEPTTINTLKDVNITSVSCGGYYSLALTEDGHVYAWGALRCVSSEQRLFHNSSKAFWQSLHTVCGCTPSTSFKPCPVADFSWLYPTCEGAPGNTNFGHSNNLEAPSSRILSGGNNILFPEGKVWLHNVHSPASGLFRSLKLKSQPPTLQITDIEWQDNPLEMPQNTLCSSPVLYENSARKNHRSATPYCISASILPPIRTISCGLSFCAALDCDGCLYTWGENTFGQLGHGDYVPRSTPEIVQKLKHERLSSVSCGAFHVAVTTECNQNGANYALYLWGRGTEGQLGFPLQSLYHTLDFNTYQPYQESDTKPICLCSGIPPRTLVTPSISSSVCGLTFNPSGEVPGCLSIPHRLRLFQWHASSAEDVFSQCEEYKEALSHSMNSGGEHQVSYAGQVCPPPPEVSLAHYSTSPFAIWRRDPLTREYFVTIPPGLLPNAHFNQEVEFMSVSCGTTHTLAIDIMNFVWSWGSGTDGQLGIGPLDYILSAESPQCLGTITSIAPWHPLLANQCPVKPGSRLNEDVTSIGQSLDSLQGYQMMVAFELLPCGESSGNQPDENFHSVGGSSTPDSTIPSKMPSFSSVAEDAILPPLEGRKTRLPPIKNIRKCLQPPYNASSLAESPTHTRPSSWNQSGSARRNPAWYGRCTPCRLPHAAFGQRRIQRIRAGHGVSAAIDEDQRLWVWGSPSATLSGTGYTADPDGDVFESKSASPSFTKLTKPFQPVWIAGYVHDIVFDPLSKYCAIQFASGRVIFRLLHNTSPAPWSSTPLYGNSNKFLDRLARLAYTSLSQVCDETACLLMPSLQNKVVKQVALGLHHSLIITQRLESTT